MNQSLPALALLLFFGSAQAVTDDSDKLDFGPDQTLRLNVVAQAETQGACDVLLGFLDGKGKVIHDAAGHPLSKRITLAPGQADFLEIKGREISDSARAELAPAIQVDPDGGAGQCPGVMASVEVLDSEPARTAMNSGAGALLY